MNDDYNVSVFYTELCWMMIMIDNSTCSFTALMLTLSRCTEQKNDQ